ncbi:MAG: secretin N-terminal domain-containing protein [Phycisphaerales bacterium]|nr:hypothetical protein [Phycisphaerales bacterium]
MALDRRFLPYLLYAAIFVPAISSPVSARQDETAQYSAITLQPTTELVDLVELVSHRMGVSLEFNRSELNKTVSLRLRDQLSDDELWDVLLSVLEGQGLSVVSTEVDGLYRVVATNKAAPEIVLPDGQAAQRAGLLAVLVRVRAGAADEIAIAIAPMLTPQTGSAKPIGSGGLLLITDSRVRVERVLGVIELIDVPPEPVESFIIELRHLSASQVNTLLEQVFAAEAATGISAPAGRIASGPRTIALPGDDRLMIIAPASRAEALRTLIGELDTRRPMTMRAYSVAGVTPTDLAASLQAVLAQQATASIARGAADTARVYADPVTGSVLVTASDADHERLGAFIDTIASQPAASRRVLRAFPIRNRDAGELLQVLADLINAEAAPTIPPNSTGAAIDTAPATQGAGTPEQTRELNRPLTTTAPTRAATTNNNTRPALSLTADEQTNAILATGDPLLIAQLESMIALLDKRQPQVMLDVFLVSLSEGDAFDLGVELRTQFQRGETAVDLASLFGLGLSGGGGSTGGFPVGTGLTGTVIRPGDFEVLVRAVESENHGKTIALPRQLVANNATASLRSVSRQPFTSINASDTVATTSFGGTEDAGVTLTLTPLIAAGDHLNLEYAIELSAFTGESTTVEGGGVIPPPSQQNSLQGQVTLPDGFTVVLGGLNSITDGVTQTRVPVLGSIPVLGALFGTQSDSTTESRFYVFVRANVMRHETFEDLRLLSAPDLRAADLETNEPTLTPLWID